MQMTSEHGAARTVSDAWIKDRRAITNYSTRQRQVRDTEAPARRYEGWSLSLTVTSWYWYTRGDSDVAESMVTIRSPFCGCNTT